MVSGSFQPIGKLAVVDLGTIQCVVGRIYDQGKWIIIDRSGDLAHISITEGGEYHIGILQPHCSTIAWENLGINKIISEFLSVTGEADFLNIACESGHPTQLLGKGELSCDQSLFGSGS